jgi:hypothetical protein
MKTILALLVVLFANYILAQNVIIVVIDGARYTETFGGTGTYIPHLYNDLKPLGALYSDFKIDYDAGARTETNPGHASIATGTWQTISNSGGEYPHKPTVFEYFRKEIVTAESDNYMLAGKNKLEYIKHSDASGYGATYQASWFGNDNKIDQQIYDLTISAMSTDHPRLMIINFAEVDAAGHTGDENTYQNALINADNLVYQLWQNIEAESYGYAPENTTMFVTNDHGRHTTDFSGHGDDCEGCTHIMLLALGRNVSQGIVNIDPHFQIDIAPTVGDLLNFRTPQAIGTSLYDGSNPLPVELFSFSASLLDNSVKLSWRTETEVSNYGFEVQKSEVSRQESEWSAIGFVEGHGNSNSPKEYSFIDGSVASGKYFYRLKQIDTDGQFEYSKVIEVDLGSPQKFELSQNYPNPFNPTTTIKFSIPQSGNVKLTVYNLLGEKVAELVNEFEEAGVYTIDFNASKFDSGVYVYKIEVNGFVQSKKMLLLK